MKVARIVALLALVQSLLLPGVESTPQERSIEVDTLGEYLFVGQAYPSGNVYLRPFSGNSKIKSFWPDGVSLIALGRVGPDLSSIRHGMLDRVLASRTENDVVKSIYIPGVEGMDESHEPCGLGEINHEDPAHELISGDFFRTFSDHCESNDGVAVYRTTGSNYSVMVIGVAGSVSLVSHKVIVDKLLRPLTPSEKDEIDRQKAESAKTGQRECSSNPSYLDAAFQIFEASIRQGNLTLRVSTYDNPGCAGHLATIYVLDVLRSGEVLKKFEFSQYQGPL